MLDSAGLRATGSATASCMVTGAGGSIGAELCRQIARFRPARLVLFDISEAALYEIERRSPMRSRSCRSSAVVGDVKHAVLRRATCSRAKPAATSCSTPPPTSTCR